MTKLYNVHIYREMRLMYKGIEADSPQTAAAIARDRLTEDADEIDDCEGETLSALVDLLGDTDYQQSRFIDFEAERTLKAAPAMRETLRYVAQVLADFKPDILRQLGLDAALEHVEKALAIADNTSAQASAATAEDVQD